MGESTGIEEGGEVTRSSLPRCIVVHFMPFEKHFIREPKASQHLPFVKKNENRPRPHLTTMLKKTTEFAEAQPTCMASAPFCSRCTRLRPHKNSVAHTATALPGRVREPKERVIRVNHPIAHRLGEEDGLVGQDGGGLVPVHEGDALADQDLPKDGEERADRRHAVPVHHRNQRHVVHLCAGHGHRAGEVCRPPPRTYISREGAAIGAVSQGFIKRRAVGLLGVERAGSWVGGRVSAEFEFLTFA